MMSLYMVGSYGWSWMPEYVRGLGVDFENAPAIDMKEYIYNMPTVMAAADIIIGRAGASSCSEIAASGTPCLLIPSPNVTDNHQEKNARALEEKGAAVVLLEKECTAEKLYEEVTKLLADVQIRDKMSTALRKRVVLDSAEQICSMMESMVKSGRR